MIKEKEKKKKKEKYVCEGWKKKMTLTKCKNF
jgi:hypothetical protein